MAPRKGSIGIASALASTLFFLFTACGMNSIESVENPPQESGLRILPLPLNFQMARDAPATYGPHELSLPLTVRAAMHVWNVAAGYEIMRLQETRHGSLAREFDPLNHVKDKANVIYVYENSNYRHFHDLARSDSDTLGICFSLGGESDIALTLELPQTRTAAHGERTVSPAENNSEVKLQANDLLLHPNTTDTFDLQSVIVHELGHALGFPHDLQSRESVMWVDGLDIQGVNRRLSASDKRKLKEILKDRYALSISITERDDPEPRS